MTKKVISGAKQQRFRCSVNVGHICFCCRYSDSELEYVSSQSENNL